MHDSLIAYIKKYSTTPLKEGDAELIKYLSSKANTKKAILVAGRRGMQIHSIHS